MPVNRENDEQFEQEVRWIQALAKVVRFVADEPLVLSQHEATAGQGRFASLGSGGKGGEFDTRVNRVVDHLGGPTEFYVPLDVQEAPPADTYPMAAMREALAVFSRARKSVVRAHLFSTGLIVLAARPSMLDLLSGDPETPAQLVGNSQSAFWEHAEAAYIRLYSFWDRVGQVLDFAFFNIRKFDQNGFTSVMDRIHANAVPMDDGLKNSASWKRLRLFQTTEKEDGLKWLLHRRNLVVHSLHLHPVPADEDSMFKSQFNHLESAHREKLRPKEPEEEAGLLISHLDRAVELFDDFLTVVEFAPSRKRHSLIS